MPVDQLPMWVESLRSHGWVCELNADDHEWYVSRLLLGIVSDFRPHRAAGVDSFGNRRIAQLPGLGPPRGLPADVSAVVLAESEVPAEWAFGHSWATLCELKAFAARHPEYAAHELVRLDWLLGLMRPYGGPDAVRVVCWHKP